MNETIQFIGVVEGAVRLLVKTPNGPMPIDLPRTKAITLAGQMEAAAETLPGTELEEEPVYMRGSGPGFRIPVVIE